MRVITAGLLKFIRTQGLMRNSPYLDARQHHIATCLDATHLVELSHQGISGNGPYIPLVTGKIEKNQRPVTPLRRSIFQLSCRSSSQPSQRIRQ